MSRKQHMRRQRQAGVRNIPWKRASGESCMAAFLRLAPPVAVRDQQRLVAAGWNPVEAAVEAWLTAAAGGEQ